MRYLIVLIIVLLLAFKLWPEQTTPTAEESFIGPQLAPLQKAENVEQRLMDAYERKDEELERASDGG